jgi:adenylosuccinate synthase
MAWGDEGKGATVDFLARDFDFVLNVRYNGGPQAAHNVVLPDGRHHTFAQFGSGSFSPGVRTHLSKYMMIKPTSQMNEANHLIELGLTDIWDRLTVDRRCVVVTPLHAIVNRMLEESRGDGRHGSCGQGIGEARKMSLENPDITLYAGDLYDSRRRVADILEMQTHHYIGLYKDFLARKDASIKQSNLEFAQLYYSWPGQVVNEMPTENVMIFEGAQGVLLDELHGDPPFYTWTDCTFGNAYKLLTKAEFDGTIKRIGCFRTYFTRHGAGPFPTEYKPVCHSDYMTERAEEDDRSVWEDTHPGEKLLSAELHNMNGSWQGPWRVGKFDFNLAKKAIGIIGGLDEIALSHNDVVATDVYFKDKLGVPVSIMGYGPTWKERHWAI